MQEKFDLHIHSNNSDGELTINDIVNEIKKSEIKLFSITDHDNINSIELIKNTNLDDIVYINGVEFSSILDKEYKIHILGYNINPCNQNIVKILNKINDGRINRFYEMADILKKEYDILLPKHELDSIINTINNPGKPHIAKLMLKHKYVNNIEEAFQKYLNNIQSSIIYREDAKVIVKSIHDADGISILAHPKKIEREYCLNIKEILPKLLEINIDGLEILNSLHSSNDAIRYYHIVSNHNLLATGGSDFHGKTIKPEVQLGNLLDNNYDASYHEITNYILDSMQPIIKSVKKK